MKVTVLSSITFGEHLKRARHARGLTQEQLAHLSNMHGSNVRRMERGEANPTLDQIVRLADALSVNPSELLPPRSP